MYINEVDFSELPVELQDKVNLEISGDNFVFICPVCRSQFIKKTNFNENEKIIYRCDDCDSMFYGDEIEVL